MVGFAGVGFVEVFFYRAVADHRVLIGVRRVFGVTGVEGSFNFGVGIGFWLFFEVGRVIVEVFGG